MADLTYYPHTIATEEMGPMIDLWNCSSTVVALDMIHDFQYVCPCWMWLISNKLCATIYAPIILAHEHHCAKEHKSTILGGEECVHIYIYICVCIYIMNIYIDITWPARLM